MNAIHERGRRSSKYDIQDPSISSTVPAPYRTFTRPRIRNNRIDYLGLFYPLPSISFFIVRICSNRKYFNMQVSLIQVINLLRYITSISSKYKLSFKN